MREQAGRAEPTLTCDGCRVTTLRLRKAPMTLRLLPPASAAPLLLLSGPRRRAETVRLLVSIGANVGDPDDAVLRFADDDAARVRQLFVELGGVRADRASVLVDASAQDVRQKLAEVAGRIAELRGGGA